MNGYSSVRSTTNAWSRGHTDETGQDEVPGEHANGQTDPVPPSSGGGWGASFGATTPGDGGFGGAERAALGGFGPPGDDPGDIVPRRRSLGIGRSANLQVEETITVTLLPEKEGMFMFQHRNYEVKSARRGSTVVRRYSDFVWLLDCLQKRFPFRQLPLLPPKRVSGMFDAASSAHRLLTFPKLMVLTFQRIPILFSRSVVGGLCGLPMPLCVILCSARSSWWSCF